jgi:asparagine synthase (glutamine-hydrolysing)
MAGAMRPRGPDGSGAVARGAVAFGHRRLSIIDLSARAAQPLVDPALGLSVAFNGCIYNFRQLRAELEALGHRFFSESDTEVIPKAWAAWGEGMLERLNGMFAFSLHDHESGRVWLARDRLGIKPLYLAEAAGRLRFASSLPALLAAGEVDTAIDPVALHHYMHFHAVVPAPRTILQGVRKLPPATVACFEPDGTRSERRYWSLEMGTPEPELTRPAGEWEEEVLAALRRAVERRLVADVPVGVLLSGGLDSSLIVGLLAEAGQELETFSIGFESVGGEEGDEFRYSDLVARRFETKHHRIRVPTSGVLPALDDCIAAQSEPMVSHDNIGFYLLSQEVARHVKVVQSGQGADEIFAGYHWYPPLLESSSPVEDYRAVFFDRSEEEYRREVEPAFSGRDWSSAFVAEQFDRPGAERAVDKALRLDTTVMLVDDPVKRVDNMTMRWSLEARVPFLDHHVVELAARVPAELKLAQGGKGVLKEAARRVIPSEVIDRPKGYFPVPALKYLAGPYLERVRDALDSTAARERGIFRRSWLEKLYASPESHVTNLGGSKLWQAAVLEMWLQARGL